MDNTRIIVGNFVHMHVDSSQLSSNFKVVLIAPYDVARTVVLSHSNETIVTVILALSDKSLWQVPVVLCHDKDRASQPACGKDSKTSQDVFGDLLMNGIENTPSKKEECSGSLNNESNIRCIHLEAMHFLFHIDGQILDMAASECMVFLLLIKGESTTIKMYGFEKLFGESTDRKLKLMKELPSNLNSQMFLENGDRRKSLFVVQCDENAELSSCSSTGSITLSKNLFISLFGKQTAYLKSLVLLLSTNTGFVFFSAVKTMVSVCNSKFLVCCQLLSSISNIVTLPVRLKKEASDDPRQVVLSSLSAALHPDMSVSSSQHIDGLLVCSLSGDCCLFLPPLPGSDLPPVLKCSLGKPVKQCLVKNDFLVCATGSTAILCKMTLIQRTDNVVIVPSVMIALEDVNITQLLPFPMHCQRERGEETEISGITKNLHTVAIPLKLEGNDVTYEKSTIPIGETLNNIRKISRKSKDLQSKNQAVDSFIFQLNIFNHLKNDISHEPQTYSSSQLIISTCSVLFKRNGHEPTWTMNVSLTNTFPVRLTDDWSVAITIQHLSQELLRVETSSSYVNTFSYHLHQGLQPQSSIDLQFPLNNIIKCHQQQTFKVLISFILHMRQDLLHLNNTGENHMKSLSTVLGCHHIDMLNFLQSSDGTVDIERNCWLDAELRSLAKPQLGSGQMEVYDKNIQTITAQVHVQASLGQHFEAPIAILKYLLAGSDIPLDTLTSLSGQFEGPNRVMIGLSVSHTEDGKKRDSNRNTSQRDYVITITGYDVTSVFETRQSVRCRLKNLNETAITKPRFQEKLLKLEKLREDLVQQIFHKSDCEEMGSMRDSEAANLASNLFRTCIDS